MALYLHTLHRSRNHTPPRRHAKEKRLRVWNKTQGHCAYCGNMVNLAFFDVDHVIPIIDYGTDDINNLMPCCRPCNLMKGTLMLDDFRVLFTMLYYEDLYTKDPNACEYYQLRTFWFEQHP
jgi:5-methylcytosine-specific restriction endonuclease McrA